MIPLAFVIGMVTGLWNGFGTFPPYSQALTAVGAIGLTAVAVLRRGDTVRWIRGDPDLPVLHIDCGRGLPWDHPGFDSGLSKMVRVTNTGSVVAPRCFAEVEGIEPLPIRGVWMDQHVESPDLAPGQSLYLLLEFPETWLAKRVTVRAWCDHVRQPATAEYMATLTDDAFPKLTQMSFRS